MRSLFLTAALLASTPAFAGGIGLIGQGGFHTENVYFYSAVDPDTNTAITDPLAYPQYKSVQLIPHFGTGLEFILGDRDDKVKGVFRGYWHADAPQGDPAKRTDVVAPEAVVASERDVTRHTALFSMGLDWGVIGDPDEFLVGASVHAGSGVVTSDDAAYFQAMVGPTASYRLSRSTFVFGDLHYVMRYRKNFEHGTQVMVGARYLFD